MQSNSSCSQIPAVAILLPQCPKRLTLNCEPKQSLSPVSCLCHSTLGGLFLFYVCGCSACMSVCEPAICTALGSQKVAFDPLALESQKIVSYRVVPGAKPRSSASATSVLKH